MPYYNRELPKYLDDPYCLRRLPGFLQRLIIELKESYFVQVELIWKPSTEVEKAQKFHPLKCYPLENPPQIEISTIKDFRVGSILHEVLHIYRFKVEHVPMLEVSLGGFGAISKKAIEELDNDIEHLFIVPKEISLWPSRKAYWAKLTHRQIRLIEAEGCNGDEWRRVIINWTFAVYVLKDRKEIKRRLLVLIDQYDLRSIAFDVEQYLLSEKLTKKAVVNKYIEALDLPGDKLEVF